jgi:uncharacterized protein YbjT (DUF2867 family)
MRVLVTGAGGVLGARVLERAVRAGYEVVATTSRPDRRFPDAATTALLDLGTGAGVSEALVGVEAVIHCASDSADHARVDAIGTRRLVEASAPGTHFVYPGIVGSDVVPLAYYRSKIASEAALRERPWTVIRTTQFHQLAWGIMIRLSRRPPLMLVPGNTRIQPLDPGSLATRLVEAAATGAQGRAPDLGGPFAYDVSALARSYLDATGTKRWLVSLNWPGLVWASLRAGANLTPNRDETGETWNDFLARRLG